MHPSNTNNSDLILAFVIGSIVFFILVAFSISYFLIFKRKRQEHKMEMTEFKKQFEKQLLQSQIEMQEQTFQHIGKELHDNVGQLLSSSRMLIGLTERSLENPPDTLLTANATLGEAINELRSLSKSLDKEWLEQFSFIDNLKAEISRINAGNMIQADLIQEDNFYLPSGELILLFRIVQEAMQNAVKHSAPKNMTIRLSKKENNLQISISDDGKGFLPDEKKNGMGLINMKHRAHLLAGSISWNSLPLKGTVVTILLPVKNEIS